MLIIQSLINDAFNISITRSRVLGYIFAHADTRSVYIILFCFARWKKFEILCYQRFVEIFVENRESCLKVARQMCTYHRKLIVKKKKTMFRGVKPK